MGNHTQIKSFDDLPERKIEVGDDVTIKNPSAMGKGWVQSIENGTYFIRLYKWWALEPGYKIKNIQRKRHEIL